MPVAIVESVSGALQLVVIGKYLLGTGYVAGRPFEFDCVGAEVNVKVQAVFEHMQILIPRAK